MARAPENVRPRAGLDDAAGVEHGHAVGDRREDAQVVMKTIARPVSRRSRSRSRMIPAWTVTSSAVVGSSATSSLGRRRAPRRSRSADAYHRRTGARRRTTRARDRGSAPDAAAPARVPRRPFAEPEVGGVLGQLRADRQHRWRTSSDPGRPSQARGRRSAAARTAEAGADRAPRRRRCRRRPLPAAAAPSAPAPTSSSRCRSRRRCRRPRRSRPRSRSRPRPSRGRRRRQPDAEALDLEQRLTSAPSTRAPCAGRRRRGGCRPRS